MTCVMRKPTFGIYKNKGADQLHSNCAADQQLCFRYIDSEIPFLPKSEITSLLPYSVAVQPGLYLTWSETPKSGFLRQSSYLSRVVRKPVFANAKTKTQISFAVTAKLISAFVFATQIYVNPGILTYLHLLFTKIFTNHNYPFKGKPLNRNQTVKSTINKL